MTGEAIRTRPGDPALEGAPEVTPEEALALPPDDPSRRAFLLRISQRLAELYSGEDVEAITEMFDPDAEVRIATVEDGGLWGGDFDESYVGREQIRRVTEQWLEPWDQLRLEPGEVIDTGGDSCVMFAEWVGTGRGSGVEVRNPYAARIALSGELIRMVDFFPSQAAALAELGLDG
jgi:ketosteroid isomerase-like protein